MNKYFRLLFVLILISGIGLVGCSKAEKSNVSPSVSEINKAINALLSDSKYQISDYQQRKAAAQNLLESLKGSGHIRDYSYDENNELFSFVYPDGTLGGISLKDFSGNSSGSLAKN